MGQHDLQARGITVKWWLGLLPERWVANMVARELVGPEGPWPGLVPGDGNTLRFSLAGSSQSYTVVKNGSKVTAQPSAELGSMP